MTTLAMVSGGLVLIVLCGLAVVAAILEEFDDPWGPGADAPVGYQLTDRGQVAADLPEAYVLDEHDETWGPA